MVSDEKIIAALKVKDYDGLELLIDKYGLRILKAIQAILNRSEERIYRKEVENEVFYRIWKKCASFDAEKAQLITWILLITKSTAIDYKRKIIRDQRLQPVADLPESTAEPLMMEKEEFTTMLELLSPEDQLIFLKRYFYQEKVEEIANDLQLSAETVYNRLSRGRKKLRKEFSQ